MLEVLPSAVADHAADEEDGVEADAEAGRVVVGLGSDGAGERGLGLGVAGLQREGVSAINRTERDIFQWGIFF